MGVVQTLKDHTGELRGKFHVKRLAVFGSRARGDTHDTSDADILVEFDQPVGLFEFVELKDYLEALLGCKVDLGTPASLKPRLRDRVLEEAVYVA
ncbi:MAG: nucleotidyltransferase family protein [Candidatus Brocadiaceae bacterium]|jgi:predicted nucleotidyltransferase